MKKNSLNTAVVAGIAGVVGLASVAEGEQRDAALAELNDTSARPAVKAPIEQRRKEEYAVYEELYRQNPDYRMGDARRRDVQKVLERLFVTSGGGSLLDVGCGRGEAMAIARAVGFTPVNGTEVVQLFVDDANGVMFAEAHSLPLPDNSYDHVLCLDTLEHLLLEDVALAVAELWRVTGHTLTISASTLPSVFGNRDLHISARPVQQWSSLFASIIGQGGSGPTGTLGGTPVWRFVKEHATDVDTSKLSANPEPVEQNPAIA